MSLSAKIREQIISSFRAELVEHVQTMTNGLLAIEQGQGSDDQKRSTLEDTFRAAHSLKGAARAVGVTVIEQMAHGLENVLDALKRGSLQTSPALFSACYEMLDAIQAVQAAYEAGETTPPALSMQALAKLAQFEPGSPQPVEPPESAPPERGEKAVAKAKNGSLDTLMRQLDEMVTTTPSEQVGPIQEEQAGPSPARIEAVQEAAPLRTEEPQPVAAPQPTATGGEMAALTQEADETIRVKVSKLDSLMDQLSELLVMKIRTEQRLNQVHDMQEFMAFWQKEWQTVRNAYSHLARQQTPQGGGGMGAGKDNLRLFEYVGDSQERLRESQGLLNNIAREFMNDATQMSLAIDELEQEVKRLRMLPLNTIAMSFGRMVRDLALQAGKEVSLHVEGGDTELDKHVLEQIIDPLIHMLRNAVDHGIEPPARRKAAGKPTSGNVTLSAEQIGKDVIIRVIDDGRGLDIEAIRHSILRQGHHEAQALGDQELAEYIFKNGVTTSPIITDLSGRGVGLDIVRRNVEALHGRYEVEWKAGKGATFTLTLPLRLTGSRGLLVRVAGQAFVIPNNAVEFILSIKPDQVLQLEGHDTIRHGGRSIALVRLGDVLSLPYPAAVQDGTEIPVVILSTAERRVAFVVDELSLEQEIVIKGLGKQIVHVNGITGATVMGSGEVVLILNAAELIKMAMRGERRPVMSALEQSAEPAQVSALRRILIVDDSITTRTLEKNILEAAGYTVQLALDGQEALSAIAASGLPDLVVSDISMPRINGFELTRRIKNNPQTNHLPVILVSSLDSPEDKAQGIEAGADAYITKGSFDQNNLLETIDRMLLPVEVA